MYTYEKLHGMNWNKLPYFLIEWLENDIRLMPLDLLFDIEKIEENIEFSLEIMYKISNSKLITGDIFNTDNLVEDLINILNNQLVGYKIILKKLQRDERKLDFTIRNDDYDRMVHLYNLIVEFNNEIKRRELLISMIPQAYNHMFYNKN